MTDHQRVSRLLADALDRPVGARRTWLDAHVRDAAERARVDALLDAHEAADADGRLDTPLLDRDRLHPPNHDAAGLGPGAERRIGPWRLLGRLGEGGMGTVYAAERADGAYERSVALKLLRVDADTDALAERLRAERQILARLDHPNIAHLYDGGMTDEGRPYLVLERVDGQPLTDFAEARALTVEARLRLFGQVCEAVAYAHRHLVVHRDLKPSNVLVTAGEDGDGERRDGVVKLLDFGIAKLLDGGDGERDDALTRSQLALTPSYAAPEQIRRAPVTTATDVYTLGVMLYELLSGQRPYTLAALTPSEAERLVCDTDPPPPSTVAPADRQRRLRGDLDTIVARALAKEPARRYPSADALAADLRRHLDGLPVEARPATAAYRVRRFARRHRVGVATAGAVALALVAGIASTAWQARVARAEADKAEAANTFLVGLLGAADPTAEGRDVRVADLLDRAAATLDSTFASTPDVAASMHRTLGITYRELGLFDEADAQLTAALRLRERTGDTRDRVDAANELGTLRLLQDRLGAADSLLTGALASARTTLGPRDALTGSVASNLAYVRFLENDLEGSLALHRESVAIEEAKERPDSTEIAAGLGNIAVVLTNLGKTDEAATILERQVALYWRRLGAGNARLARALNNLGSAYHASERTPEALRAATEAVDVFRRTVPADSPELAGALSNLAPVLMATGRAADAETVLTEAMAIYEPSVGPDHMRTNAARIKLGQAQQAQGRTAEAEATLRAALATADAHTPDAHPARAHARVALARTLVEAGRADEAVPLLRDAVAARDAALPDGHADRAVARSLLGDALRRSGQTAEAAPLLRESHAALARTLGARHRLTAEAAARLAALPR